MQKTPKNPKKYSCEICDFNTCNKKDYAKHMATDKHQIRTLLNDFEQENPKKPHLNICEFCGKSYAARSGLWYHNKKCNQKHTLEMENTLVKGKDQSGDQNDQDHNQKINSSNSCDFVGELSKDELILLLLKQNAELIKCQQDVTNKLIENGTSNIHSNNTTTHTNSHNKAFNLNFFLNETCKNAMNITEFVDSIKLQLSDFIEVGELGYVEGISKIIVKNLNALDETIRPIHCTDKKRETFYVKDEDKWEKQEKDMKKIKIMINRIADKNQKLMPAFKEKYPDYKDSQSKRSDQYSKTVIEALGGKGDNDTEKEEKIIKNISRATIISSKF